MHNMQYHDICKISAKYAIYMQNVCTTRKKICEKYAKYMRKTMRFESHFKSYFGNWKCKSI